jgi:hypothetical protein
MSFNEVCLCLLPTAETDMETVSPNQKSEVRDRKSVGSSEGRPYAFRGVRWTNGLIGDLPISDF